MNDLISKDKLYNDLNKLWDIAKEKGYKELSALISDRIVPLIVAQPTVEAKEIVHGHWIEKEVSSGRDSWECSVCGRRARGKIENLPYCHCGAKMDEVRE